MLNNFAIWQINGWMVVAPSGGGCKSATEKKREIELIGFMRKKFVSKIQLGLEVNRKDKKKEGKNSSYRNARERQLLVYKEGKEKEVEKILEVQKCQTGEAIHILPRCHGLSMKKPKS